MNWPHVRMALLVVAALVGLAWLVWHITAPIVKEFDWATMRELLDITWRLVVVGVALQVLVWLVAFCWHFDWPSFWRWLTLPS